MAAVRHLGFSKIRFLTIGNPWAADFPSWYKIWFKNIERRWNYGLKSKSKMAAVRHLGFVTSSYRTTHEVSSFGHIGPSNFMLIRCIVLKIWRFEIFADLAWNAYSRPKNFGFWGSEPLNVIGHHRDPQKAPPWLKPHLHANFRADRLPGATCARAEGMKKKEKRKKSKERNLQWQTRCSHRPPTLTHRYVVLHAGWSSGGSYKFQVSSKSVERFSSCGGVEICHFLYLRPVAYITACTTVQAVM